MNAYSHPDVFDILASDLTSHPAFAAQRRPPALDHTARESMQVQLIRADRRARNRRFTGAPLTDFGALMETAL